MISYYDLLGMIKEGNIPYIVAIHQNSGVINYVAQYDCGEFSYYQILNSKDANIDNHFYLSDCLLDSEMHKECIEIIKVHNEASQEHKIEKFDVGKMLQKRKWKRDRDTWNKINEIIDIINKMSD